MAKRRFWIRSLTFAAAILTAGFVWALGFELAESKEKLGLKYDVAVTDHGTGRVTAVLTITDDGRLKPIRSVDLFIPGEDKSGYVDLSVSLAIHERDGKLTATAHLKRELAERASFHLITDTLDGKQLGLTWYYHVIPLADAVKNAKPAKP